MSTNQEIEKHFRIFVNYDKNNWADKLPIVKFAANNNNSTFISLSPFFALKGLYLRISFDIIDFSNITIYKRINKKNAINISKVI